LSESATFDSTQQHNGCSLQTYTNSDKSLTQHSAR